MQEKIQKQILDAFFVVLRPIAKILLRYGIGYREFAEVAKTAFVDVATSEYGIRGRPTNISRVAVMSGLTRKEVRRIRDQLADENQSYSLKSTPLAKILHRWHSEDEYLDDNGRPATLPFSGIERSFSSLVQKYGGDIPPGAMRTELKRVGAVVEEASGAIRPVRRSLLPDTDHETLRVSLMQGAYPLLSTISHNTDPERKTGKWMQMTAYTSDIKDSDITRLRRICEDRARESVETFDDLFGAYEKLNADDDAGESTKPVALGVFYFEEANPDSAPLWRV